VVNVTKVSLRGANTKLDFSNLVSGAAITLTGSASDGQSALYDQNTVAALESLRIYGDDEAGSLVGIDFVPGADTKGASHVLLRDVLVRDFGIGERHGANTYLVKHVNVSYYSCGLPVQSVSGANRGENLEWFGGVVGNCSAGFALTGVSAAVHGMSFDYNAGVALALGASTKVDVYGGNWESDNEASAWWTATGNGTELHFHGGTFVHAGTAPQDNTEFATASAGAVIRFSGARLHNFRNATERFGSGRVLARDSSMFATSDMPPTITDDASGNVVDGSFEANTGALVQIEGAADWTNRLSGTNLTAALSATTAQTGSQSLALTKSGGVSASAKLLIFVPVPREGALASFSIAERDIGDAVTGTYQIDEDWVMATKNENGIMSVVKNQSIGSLTSLTHDDSWTTRRDRPHGDRPAPAWATHLRLSLNLTSTGNGAVYFDDFQVAWW
jgi:hypothetical protein